MLEVESTTVVNFVNIIVIKIIPMITIKYIKTVSLVHSTKLISAIPPCLMLFYSKDLDRLI